jgi:hypothetical protein
MYGVGGEGVIDVGFIKLREITDIILSKSLVAPPKSSPVGRTLRKSEAKVSPSGGDLEGA